MDALPTPRDSRILFRLAGKTATHHTRKEYVLPEVPPDLSPEYLMPYEAVAKAIFIKANGAIAYYRATGLPGRKTTAQ